MRRHFDEELIELQHSLVGMAGLAEKMLRLSVNVLVERNERLAEEVFGLEKQVNELHIRLDEAAIRLIALRQPVAGDLRLLVMSAKISGELERIADQAVNVCESAHFMLQHQPITSLEDIRTLTKRVETMVWDSIDAYVRKDAALAQDVLGRESKVDELNSRIFRDLVEFMAGHVSLIQPAFALTLISRNLEKIGDHATNIAEEVIHIVQGRDVRHAQEMKKMAGKEHAVEG
jgi:phosphate transport system protein